jgi:hypothetical protein
MVMAGQIDAVRAIHNAFRQDIRLIDAAALDAARGKTGLESTVERKAVAVMASTVPLAGAH